MTLRDLMRLVSSSTECFLTIYTNKLNFCTILLATVSQSESRGIRNLDRLTCLLGESIGNDKVIAVVSRSNAHKLGDVCGSG